MNTSNWAVVLLLTSQIASAGQEPEPSAPPAYSEKGSAPEPSAPPASFQDDPPTYHSQQIAECQKSRQAANEVELFPGARDGANGSDGNIFGFWISTGSGASADDVVIDTPPDGRALHVQAVGRPGQRGNNGRDGEDAGRIQLPEDIAFHRQNYRAGNGGNGGNGAAGGAGGHGGNLTVFYRNADKSDIGHIVANLSGGAGGAGGQGGRGGRADDAEDQWTYHCAEHGIDEVHSIIPGKPGRDGRDGASGRRGAVGQLTIIPITWKSEFERGTLKRKRDERPITREDFVVLRDVNTHSHAGATELLGHGSVVQDVYTEVEVKEIAATIVWQISEQKRAQLRDRLATYFLNDRGQVNASVPDHLLRQDYDAASNTLYIKDIVAQDAVVGFKIDQVEGELSTLAVDLIDQRSDEFRNSKVRYSVDVQVPGYFGFASVLRSPIEVPEEFIERSGDRVMIQLGEWIKQNHTASLWRLHRGGAYFDKHVRVRVTAKTYLANGFNCHAQVSRRVDDKINADQKQDDQQMPWSGRVFEWLCPVSWI